MAVIDELLVGLGFDYDPKDMAKFKEDVSKTSDIVKKLSGAAIGAAASIVGLTVASTSASDEQGKLADEVGISVENLDALQFALRSSGGSAEGMASSLRSLSQKASEAARGVGSGVEAFGMLGISATDTNGNIKDSSDLMLEISKRFQGISKSKQLDLAGQLGVTDSIRLLQQTPEAIRDLSDSAKELGVTTAEDAKSSAKFQDSLLNIWTIAKQMSRLLSRQFVPIIQSVTDGFTEWWKANRTIIEQNLPDWIDKATMAIKILTIAAGAWLAMRLVSHMVTLVGVMKSFSAATMLANASALLLPALIAAVVAGIVLLVDEIATFLNGGDTFLGDLVDKFPILGEVIYGVADAFKFLGEIASGVWDTITSLIETISNFELPEAFTSAVESVKNFSLDGALDSTGEFLNSINPFSSDNPNTIPELGSSSVSNSSSTSVDKIEIRVDGSGDPSSVANEVFNIFQQTSQDLNTAVDY